MYPKCATLDSVKQACASRPDVAPFARIVGQWVWCEFTGKPSDDTRQFLKDTGFRWNADRGAWQHPCGLHSKRNRHIDPRRVYGQKPLFGEESHKTHRDQRREHPRSNWNKPRSSEQEALRNRIEKLGNMTEARGATPGEAANARTMRERLQKQYAQQYGTMY